MSYSQPNNPIPSTWDLAVSFRSVVYVALALSFPLSLGACATDNAPRDTGERLSDRGTAISAYGTSWSDGQKSVRKGEKSIVTSARGLADGERDLAKARKDLARAEQRISDAAAAKEAAQKQIDDGKLEMARAEADYAATRAGPSAVGPR